MNKNTENNSIHSVEDSHVEQREAQTELTTPTGSELEGVDEDIRQYFQEDMSGRYTPTLPILIQISRQLRFLCEKTKNGN